MSLGASTWSGRRRGGVAALLAASLVVPALVLSSHATAASPRSAAPITPWLGTWTGSVTATPTPTCASGKPACPNPFEVDVTIKSAALGLVVYPSWKCKGTAVLSDVTPTVLQLTVKFAATGPFECPDVTGTFTALGSGLASWAVATDSGASTTESYSGVLTAPSVGVTPVCTGTGSCGVSAASPQVVCLTATNCPVGGVLTSTVTVGAFTNGSLAPNKAVTIHFLSTSKSTSSGSWCQGANGTMKTGHTNSSGLFQFSYTTAGPNVPKIPSFCMMKVTVGKSSVIEAIDQTNDPAPYKVAGSPKTLRRRDLPNDHALIALVVTRSHHAVIGDPTTFYSEIPSVPGACGSLTPLVRKTRSPHGKATLVYAPSTTGGKVPKVSCTLVGQEADSGALSNKVVIYQTNR